MDVLQISDVGNIDAAGLSAPPISWPTEAPARASVLRADGPGGIGSNGAASAWRIDR